MRMLAGVAAVLAFDFDRTIVENDLTEETLAAFGAPPDALDDGPHASEQRIAAAISQIEATAEQIEAFAAGHARVRDGFLQLTDWAHWHGWYTALVTPALDRWVDPVLDGLGLDRIARHRGRARFAYRWRAFYPSPRGVELEQGFSLSYLAAFRDAGDFVVRIGAAEEDAEAAEQAHAVFAHDGLLERLRGRHERLYGWETLGDVLRTLDRDGEGWLAAFMRK